MLKQLAVMLLGVGLSGCSTYSLQQLRLAELNGTPFQQALAREYIALSEREERNFDWRDSWHFADKGLVAAYGNDVGPEILVNWDIAADKLAELEKARDDLLTALTPPVVEAQPELAARAYGAFDCWVEAQDDAWQEEKITACKNSFYEILSGLQSTKFSDDKAVDTTSYVVFFEWNRANLSASAAKQVDEVARNLADETGYEVVLNGHTDTTGLEKFNLTLSKKRAVAVAARLEAGGVAKDAIKIFAFGESDPKVPTADGVSEPKNRRVEIFIQ